VEATMSFVLDLSDLKTERIIIVGDIKGDHNRFINMLYQQRFNYKDTLITTGNFIDENNPKSIETILFLKNSMNCYSVKGDAEFTLLRKSEEDRPVWLKDHPKTSEIVEFIDKLPLIIKVSDYIYVVNAGIQPTKPIDEQDPEVFYSIGTYDKDSRFYQFDNPKKKSWYEFDIYEGSKLLKFCFSNVNANKIEVPAGYYLGRNTNNRAIRGLIIRPGQGNPILIEST
jgi:hypothetical protein